MNKLITETDRLSIVEASLTDVEFFYQLLNSPNWLEHIGDRGIETMKDAESYIQNSLIDSYTSNGFGLYKMVVKSEGAPVGICGFVKRDYLKHPDIGFAILPEFERQGYTLEASLTLYNYGKEVLKMEHILGITTRENIGSQKILERIGLKQSGRVIPPNDPKELLLYSD